MCGTSGTTSGRTTGGRRSCAGSANCRARQRRLRVEQPNPSPFPRRKGRTTLPREEGTSLPRGQPVHGAEGRQEMVATQDRAVSAWRKQVQANVKVAGSGPPVV